MVSIFYVYVAEHAQIGVTHYTAPELFERALVMGGVQLLRYDNCRPIPEFRYLCVWPKIWYKTKHYVKTNSSRYRKYMQKAKENRTLRTLRRKCS